MFAIKNKISLAKKLSPEEMNTGHLAFHSDIFLTEQTWQELTEGYLTSLSFVNQFTFGLR